MQEKLATRTKRVLAYLALSIFLAGGSISLASMETNPFKWPCECRPVFVLVAFLFFQWLYRDRVVAEQEEKNERSKGAKEYRVDKDKDYYKRMK